MENNINMRYDNIVDLATVIRNAMKEHLETYPDNESQAKIEQYALLKAMKFMRGLCSPETIQQLIHLEHSVYSDSKIAFKGLLQC